MKRAIMLAMILVVGASAAPYCVFDPTISPFIDANTARYMWSCDGVLMLKPAAIFENKPQAPAGVELKSEWLINLYQHPDSSMILTEKKEKGNFFWQGIIPKYQEVKMVLVGKYYRTDSWCSPIYWQKVFGQEKTSIWLVIFIISLLLASFLAGLSLRSYNKDLGGIAVGVVFVMPIAMTMAVKEPMMAIATLLAAIAAGVAACAIVRLKVIIFFLASIILSAIAIAVLTKLLLAFVILAALELAIFFSALYLKVGVARKV
jgi:hypothetical protein